MNKSTAELLVDVSPFPASIQRLHSFFMQDSDFKTTHKSELLGSRFYFYNDGSCVVLHASTYHSVSGATEADFKH